MPYLSQILGNRVVDSVGQPMGHIVDLAITVEEPFGGDFPPATLVLVRAGSANLRLRWELIADLNAMGAAMYVCSMNHARGLLQNTIY